jgi:chemotaxis methyl-accepting protein methylase
MTDADKDFIFNLALELTGADCSRGNHLNAFIMGIQRRMEAARIDNVREYAAWACEDPIELPELISALSIHTTHWFRENPHIVLLQRAVLARPNTIHPFRVWSCACSTGEETYTFALLLEEFRRFHSGFEYRVHGSDIDPVSLKAAKRGIYRQQALAGPVAYYKNEVLLGSGPTAGYFTFTKNLRDRVTFSNHDLREALEATADFDVIVCRNVLMYFSADTAKSVIRGLLAKLRPGGLLILGHSEAITAVDFGLLAQGHSVYLKPAGEFVPIRPKRLKPVSAPRLILIGASTGGPAALDRILRSLPASTPPVLIAQHISADFTQTFAEHLAQASGLRLGAAETGSPLLPGHIYCAQPDHHLAVREADGTLTVRQNERGSVGGHCPNIDHLFESAVPVAPSCLAILLSGMGRDGVAGLEKLHLNGAKTAAQSADDSVVFGMPREAIAINAADFVGSSPEIREFLLETISRPPT